MNEIINIYSDESCHLEHDNQKNTILGATYCHRESAEIISRKIKEIKIHHGIPPFQEIKWAKISPSKTDFYKNMIDLFFDEKDLCFRVLVASKKNLNHEEYGQTHSDWYYKMYHCLLKWIFNKQNTYFYCYLDPKDTRIHKDTKKLEYFLEHYSNGKIKMLEPINSAENHIMQLNDVLIGCIKCLNDNITTSPAKIEVANYFNRKAAINLNQSSRYKEQKINIFFWHPKENATR